MASNSELKKKAVFKVGVNLTNEDGTEVRYEAGDPVPKLTAKQLKALREMDAIEE